MAQATIDNFNLKETEKFVRDHFTFFKKVSEDRTNNMKRKLENEVKKAEDELAIKKSLLEAHIRNEATTHGKWEQVLTGYPEAYREVQVIDSPPPPKFPVQRKNKKSEKTTEPVPQEIVFSCGGKNCKFRVRTLSYKQ